MPNASSSSVRCRSDITNVGGPPRAPGKFGVLPEQLHAQLHLALAAGELPIVQEQVGSDIRIGSAQGVVYRANQHPSLKNGGLGQGEVAMVEGIEGIDAELQGCSFAQLRVLEQPHVPDVYSWSLEAVAAERGKCAQLCLNVTGVGVPGNVSDDICTTTGATASDGCDAGHASWSSTHVVDRRPKPRDAIWVKDGTVAGSVSV